MLATLSPHRPRRSGRSDGPLRRAGEVIQSGRAAELAALRARVATLELDNYRLAARVEELEAELAAALARERHLARRIHESSTPAAGHGAQAAPGRLPPGRPDH